MLFMTEPTEAECFEAEKELLFDVHFRQFDREIRKMIEQDKQKGAKNIQQPAFIDAEADTIPTVGIPWELSL